MPSHLTGASGRSSPAGRLSQGGSAHPRLVPVFLSEPRAVGSLCEGRDVTAPQCAFRAPDGWLSASVARGAALFMASVNAMLFTGDRRSPRGKLSPAFTGTLGRTRRSLATQGLYFTAI